MNILMISETFPPKIGGIATYFSEIANSLWNKGENVLVLTPQTQNDHHFDYKQKYPIKRLKEGNLPVVKRLFGIIQIFRYIYKFKPEIVYFSNWCPYSPFLIYLSKYIRKFWLAKLVCAAHGSEILRIYTNYSSYRFFRITGKTSLLKLDKILSVSNYTKTLLLGLGVSKEIVRTIPNGINLDEFNHHDSNSDTVLKKYELERIKGKFILITVSKIVKRKGHQIVINTLPKLIESGIDVHYLIIGKGEYETNLREQIKKNNLDQRVSLLGHVSRSELLSLYQLSDLFVMPCIEDEAGLDVEGFGIVYLEANACKLPVIGTYTGGIPDAISHGNNGFLISPNSVQELYQSIIDYFNLDNNEKMKFRNNCYKYVKKYHTWDLISKEIIRELREMLYNR